MNKYLIDTDVLIELLRGNRRIISYLDDLHKEGNAFFYSPVTKAEIFHGVRKGEEGRINLLFHSMECVPVSDEIGGKAGLYLKQFHLSHSVQVGDAIIAASAFYAGAVLVTCNEKHYPMKDIKVIAPVLKKYKFIKRF
jgi:predicted nucleic acid-binding protein